MRYISKFEEKLKKLTNIQHIIQAISHIFHFFMSARGMHRQMLRHSVGGEGVPLVLNE
jgi:hypothetical protein